MTWTASGPGRKLTEPRAGAGPSQDGGGSASSPPTDPLPGGGQALGGWQEGRGGEHAAQHPVCRSCVPGGSHPGLHPGARTPWSGRAEEGCRGAGAPPSRHEVGCEFPAPGVGWACGADTGQGKHRSLLSWRCKRRFHPRPEPPRTPSLLRGQFCVLRPPRGQLWGSPATLHAWECPRQLPHVAGVSPILRQQEGEGGCAGQQLAFGTITQGYPCPFVAHLPQSHLGNVVSSGAAMCSAQTPHGGLFR